MTPINNQQESLVLNQTVASDGLFPGGSGGNGEQLTIGTIRTYGFDFLPGGSLDTDGAPIPIASNTSLFSIAGPFYGGDGTNTFAMPDLEDNIATGQGQGTGLTNRPIGESFGDDDISLTGANLPATVGGGGQPFDNVQASQAVVYAINTGGTFPSRSGSSATGHGFLGEVNAFAAANTTSSLPSGWVAAEGQILDISSNAALFSLLGTQYGGNGRTTFALPDLRGRTVVGAEENGSGGTNPGMVEGSETVSLSQNQLPASAGGNDDTFDNVQPSLGLTYLVATTGVFPFEGGGSPPSDETYLGEIVAFAGNFVPSGYALANGQLLPISSNTALFSLFGTTYGGDGSITFGLPNLIGRSILDENATNSLGDVVGTDDQTVIPANLDGIAIAIDDAFTVVESGTLTTGNVFDANPTTADTDSDDPLMVTAVNGGAANVGNQITLPSGALLTLNSDGTFTYDPDGSFNFLPDLAASGASNTTATDTFTYELNGDDTATVTVTINGEDSNFDFAVGTPVADTIDAGIGDDTVDGLGGGDALDGGAGNDTLSYANSSVAVTANLFTNTFNGGDATGDTVTNFESIEGSTFDDLLVGDLGGNTLKGSGGNDVLNGSSGDDTVDGGAGDDTLLGGAGADAFKGGAGTDTLSYFNSNGGVQVDLTAETFTGAHAAGDSFIVGVDVENLSGSTFDDVLTGTSGDNVMIGFAGNDTLSGLGGDDQLLGQQGDDTLTGGAGADVLNGGIGSDTASYAGSSAALSINLLARTAAGGEATGDTLISIENVTGTDFADTIFGNNGNNTLIGMDGGDFINGLAGDDIIEGGDGNDIIVGSAGADILDGKAGVDTVSYFNSVLGVNVDIRAQTGSGGDAEGDRVSQMENVIGSNGGDDTLRGNALDNRLFGFAGSDTLNGGLGDDVMFLGLADGVQDRAILEFTFFGTDSVVQFEDGIDIIDVSALGITFADVNARASGAGGADTLITFTGGTGKLVLTNFDFNNIDASDFDFGGPG